MSLVKEEYELLEKLVNICGLISNNYKLLKEENNLEKRNEIINNIKKYVELENECYQKFDLTNSKLEEIKKCFFGNNQNLTLGAILSLAETDNEFLMIHNRIILKFQDLINKKIVKINKNEIMNYIINPKYNREIDTLTNIHYAALDNDLCNTIYYMVDNYTKDNEYEEFNVGLQSLKYNISYLWPSVEENNLETNFQNEELFWSYKMYCDILNIPCEEIEMGTIIGMCKFFLDLLLEELFYDRSKLSDQDITNALIYLRTGLMFAPRDIIDTFKERFNVTVVHNYAKYGNLKIEGKILEILNSNLDDKSIPKLVRFNNKYKNKKI